MDYKEGKDSTFTHFGKEHYVDDLIALTKGMKTTPIEVKKLDWIFDDGDPDQARVDQASLSFPIIVTKDDVDGEMKYIVVDGTHRLAKAKQQHKFYVQCYVVDKDEVRNLPVVKRKSTR